MAFWTKGKEQEKLIEESFENLKTLETALKGKFFGGASIGLVDIAACFIGAWVAALQEVVGIILLDGEKLPALFKWTEDFMSVSVVQKSLPPREGLTALFNEHKEILFAKRSWFLQRVRECRAISPKTEESKSVWAATQQYNMREARKCQCTLSGRYYPTSVLGVKLIQVDSIIALA
ncbi:hypothetical protein ACLOJK_000079 [Asimina triloba]